MKKMFRLTERGLSLQFSRQKAGREEREQWGSTAVPAAAGTSVSLYSPPTVPPPLGFSKPSSAGSDRRLPGHTGTAGRTAQSPPLISHLFSLVT